MTESIVFIYNEGQINQLKDLLRHKPMKVVCISESLYPILKDGRISFTEINDYKTIKPIEEIQYESFTISETWYKSIEKEFLIDGISIFECIERDIFNFIHPVIKYIDIVENVLKDENPMYVYVFGYNDLITSIITDVCIVNKVNVVYQRNNFMAVKYLFIKNIKPLVLFVADIAAGFKRKYSHTGRDKNINNTNIDILGVGIYPMNFESIEKKYSLCFACVEYNPIVNREWEIAKNINTPCFPIEKYWCISDVFKSIKYIAKFNKLSKNESNLMKYKHYNLIKYVMKNYIYYFTIQRSIMKGAEFISSSQRIVKKLNPRIIIVPYDRTVAQRAVIEVGKKHNIPSVMIQHGVAHSHVGTSKMVADIYAVYGETSKKAYVEVGYDPNRVKVVGIPKYDLIIRKVKRYNKEELCRKFGIDPDKKIILYISGPFPKSEYYLYFEGIKKAFDYVRKHIDSTLIVKLHQLEHIYQVKDIIKEQVNTKLFKYEDTWELLYISDVVITVMSTAVLEGLIINKPAIMIDPLNKYDDPYTRDEAAIKIKDFELLSEAISNVLTGRTKIPNENIERCVYNLAYKVDGKSTERLVELISSIISDKNTLK